MQVFNWNVVHLPVADDGLHLLNLADDHTLGKWLEYISRQKHLASAEMCTDLAFTDSPSTMTAVAVHTEMLRTGRYVCTCRKRTLILCATLLTAFMKCIAVQFRHLFTWNSRQTMQPVSVLADHMLQQSQRHQLLHSFVRVRRPQHRVGNATVSRRRATRS